MYEYEGEEYFNPEEFIEQHEVEIREILLKAVNSKIKDTIEELERQKEQNGKLSEELGELRHKLRFLEREHKSRLEVALKDKELEVQRKLGLGFAVNDEVYYMKPTRNSVKCDKCNGDYKLEVMVLGKQTTVNCPHCSGGNIISYTYLPVKDTISSLKFWIAREEGGNKKSAVILKESWDIYIYLDKCDGHKRPKDLFISLEECQKACDGIHDRG